jgi:hypothetical protein
LAIDLFESISKECDLLSLLECLDSKICEFSIVRTQSPIIPDEHEPDQTGDDRSDRGLFDPQLRDRKLNGA